MLERPTLPSLDVVLSAVENGLDVQRQHLDSIDGKAGVTLGFAGAIAALAGDVDTGLQKAGVALAIVAGVLAIMAFSVRKIPIVDVRGVRRYLTAQSDFAKLRLVDSGVALWEEGRRMVRTKGLWLQAALSVLVSSVVMLGLGTLVK